MFSVDGVLGEELVKSVVGESMSKACSGRDRDPIVRVVAGGRGAVGVS